MVFCMGKKLPSTARRPRRPRRPVVTQEPSLLARLQREDPAYTGWPLSLIGADLLRQAHPNSTVGVAIQTVTVSTTTTTRREVSK